MRGGSISIVILLFVLSECRGDSDVTPRDSYVKAAEHSASLKGIEGYNGNPMAYYYQIHPSIHYGGHDEEYKDFSLIQDEADSKQDFVGILSLALGKLKSLSWVSTAIILILLSPILIPFIIAPILFLGLLIYFIPVIKIDLGIPPGEARKVDENIATTAMRSLETTGRLLYNLSMNEQCIQRLNCEISYRATNGGSITKWIKGKLDKYDNPIMKRISRFFNQIPGTTNCSNFTCSPSKEFRRIQRSFNRRKLN